MGSAGDVGFKASGKQVLKPGWRTVFEWQKAGGTAAEQQSEDEDEG